MDERERRIWNADDPAGGMVSGDSGAGGAEVSAPLTLAEVREQKKRLDTCRPSHYPAEIYIATIEWLVERIGTANLGCVGPDDEWCPYYNRSEDEDCGGECFEAEEELEAWLRGES